MEGHLRQGQAMIDTVTERSHESGVRPLAMFSSGCKDYGEMDKKDGDLDLAPHTETSPLNMPEPLIPRASFGTALFENTSAPYDGVVLRPTIVYGLSSSYYGALFDHASKSKSVLQFIGDPRAIMHSLHVDNCADAYVALAEYPERSEVAHQAFNLSNAQYETAQQIGEALAKSWGLTLEVVAPSAKNAPQRAHPLVHALINFSQ